MELKDLPFPIFEKLLTFLDKKDTDNLKLVCKSNYDVLMNWEPYLRGLVWNANTVPDYLKPKFKAIYF